MAKSRLHGLAELGQSVWIDSLSRGWLKSGDLARWMDEDALTGVTSNPTIFQKAMSEGDWYDDQLREVLAEENDLKEIFLQLAITDIEEACDLFRSVWDEGDGKDGYVSMEVDPNFAYDTSATIEEAARFHDWVERPNLYVKIPATAPGLPAIEEMIARGRNINVTLIFSLERHKEVAEAYIRGLERLAEAGGDLSTVGSVASYFVSRVDTEADPTARRGRAPRAEGEARRREREARVPELQGDLLGRPVGRARRERRDAAVVPLGVDLDEEPRVPRRAVRRGSDRRGDGEHDAARDDRGLPGPRRGRAHARGRDRRGEAGLRAGRGGRASTTTTSPTRSSAKASRSSSTRSHELLDGIAAKRGQLAAA